MKEDKKVKKEKSIRIDNLPMDVCNKCGVEFYDVLGIGSCGKCFDKIKKLYK